MTDLLFGKILQARKEYSAPVLRDREASRSCVGRVKHVRMTTLGLHDLINLQTTGYKHEEHLS